MKISPISYFTNNNFKGKYATKMLPLAVTYIAATFPCVSGNCYEDIFETENKKLNDKDAERALFNALNSVNGLDLESLKENDAEKFNNLKNLCDNAIFKQQNNELTVADINELVNILFSELADY